MQIWEAELDIGLLTGRSGVLPALVRCAHGPLGPGGLAQRIARIYVNHDLPARPLASLDGPR